MFSIFIKIIKYYLDMDNKKKLGLKIKELRKRKGVTQEQLAERTKFNQCN